MAPKVCECCGQVMPDEFVLVARQAKLSKKQTELFLAVAAGRGNPVAVKRIQDAMYVDDIDGGPLNAHGVTMVQIHRCNVKLSAHGYRIANCLGFGYRLTAIIAEAA